MSNDLSGVIVLFVRSSVMRRLHDPTVGPTGRSNRLVQQLAQQLRRVNGRPTDWSNQLDESNMSNSSNRLNQQSHH